MKRWTSDRTLPLLLPALAGLGALCLYVTTAAPWLTWAHDGADGGDLIAAAMTWGVPHPSGYPTYCLLGRLSSLLPLGPIARRFNLLSAAMGALAVALLCALLRRELSRRSDDTLPRPLASAAVVLISWTWASGSTLWSQATIAEVYAPLAAMLMLCLYVAIRYTDGPRTERRSPPLAIGVLGLLLGLSAGMHLTALLLVPGLVALLWAGFPRVGGRSALAGASGLLLGLCVYLYLPLAARGDPPINWGDPETWSGFWWTVSGAPYRGYVLGLPLRYLPLRLIAWVALWREQFTLPGVLLALAGLSERWRRCRRQALGELLIVGAFSLVAITYDTVDSYVYQLPAYPVAALWLATGSVALYRTVRRRLSPQVATILLLALLALLPAWSVANRFGRMSLSGDREAQEWTQATLAALPRGALLITGQDAHTFALDYAQWVEGQRPDLCMVDGELLPYPWYREALARRCPDVALAGAPPSVAQLVAAQWDHRPLYLASPRPELAEDWHIEERNGLWQIVAPQPTPR